MRFFDKKGTFKTNFLIVQELISCVFVQLFQLDQPWGFTRYVFQ